MHILVAICIVQVYQLAPVVFTKSQFHFQGESDDCINRLAKKDGLLAKYVSECESLMLPVLGFRDSSCLTLNLLLDLYTVWMSAVLPVFWRYVLPPFLW